MDLKTYVFPLVIFLSKVFCQSISIPVNSRTVHRPFLFQFLVGISGSIAVVVSQQRGSEILLKS